MMRRTICLVTLLITVNAVPVALADHLDAGPLDHQSDTDSYCYAQVPGRDDDIYDRCAEEQRDTLLVRQGAGGAYASVLARTSKVTEDHWFDWLGCSGWATVEADQTDAIPITAGPEGIYFGNRVSGDAFEMRLHLEGDCSFMFSTWGAGYEGDGVYHVEGHTIDAWARAVGVFGYVGVDHTTHLVKVSGPSGGTTHCLAQDGVVRSKHCFQDQ